MDNYAISRENLPIKGNVGQSKIGVKQIQDGGRLPSWKYINRCISAISGLICTKFGLQIDIRHTGVTGPNIILLLFGLISVVNKDSFVKFSTLIDIGHTRVTVA